MNCIACTHAPEAAPGARLCMSCLRVAATVYDALSATAVGHAGVAQKAQPGTIQDHAPTAGAPNSSGESEGG